MHLLMIADLGEDGTPVVAKGDRLGCIGSGIDRSCAVKEDLPPVAPKIRIARYPTEEDDPLWRIGEMTTLLPI